MKKKRNIKNEDEMVELAHEAPSDADASVGEEETLFLDQSSAMEELREVEAASELAGSELIDENEEQVTRKEKAREGDADRTAYTLYLREIGQSRLITPAEEVELAGRIRAGNEEAREQMIKANLRLVVKIAREYEDYGVPLLDLINEGNMGLMKAVERFDPTKGAKLSTYAAWWIKQSIRRALSNQSKTIRLPVHVGDKLLHMRRAAVLFEKEFGREPTNEELAFQLGMSAGKLSALRKAALPPSSLDAPVGDEDGKQFGEFVEDERADTPYAQLEDKTTMAMLLEMLDALPDRERVILRFRFGLDGEGEKTLEEVGKHFGVTRERIRQIQNLALGKLRKLIEKREAPRLAA